ncbi:GMC oxidoreductase [Streptomyces sp. B6B3]|uniref:GMC oxidoreductase n=1 Tax=Streptomyces sp. B6B3 TaxID=3153570 RepID=UPI00325EADD2
MGEQTHDPTTGPRVIVLGGGMSGLATAQRLAAHGVGEIVVAEAGERSLDDHINAVMSEEEIENRWRVPGEDPVLWRPWSSTLPPHYDGATGLRRQLGGRSLYWHGVVLRMDPWALADSAAWPDVLGADQRLYQEVERELTTWCGQPLQAPRSDTEESFLDWFRTAGHAEVERTPLAAQRFETDAGPRWRAFSPLYAGWGPAATAGDCPAVRIRTGVRAIGIAADAGGVRALLQDPGAGAPRWTRADALVLAAGALENTRLVAQALGERDPRHHEFPGLSDHILQGFVVHLPRNPWGTGGGDGACLLLRGDADSRSNLFVKLIDVPGVDGVVVDAWEMGEQEPSELNAVEYRDRARAPWPATVRTGLTARDADLVAGQQARLQLLWERLAGALDLPATRLDFGDYLTANREVTGYLDRAVGTPGTAESYVNTLGGTDHESGTLPYGRILDPTGQVRGAPGVFVVGPAAFPRPGAANPSLTTLALARHTADQVVRHLDGPDVSATYRRRTEGEDRVRHGIHSATP